MLSLSDDVLELIVSYMWPRDVASLSRTCKSMRAAVNRVPLSSLDWFTGLTLTPNSWSSRRLSLSHANEVVSRWPASFTAVRPSDDLSGLELPRQRVSLSQWARICFSSHPSAADATAALALGWMTPSVTAREFAETVAGEALSRKRVSRSAAVIARLIDSCSLFGTSAALSRDPAAMETIALLCSCCPKPLELCGRLLGSARRWLARTLSAPELPRQLETGTVSAWLERTPTRTIALALTASDCRLISRITGPDMVAWGRALSRPQDRPKSIQATVSRFNSLHVAIQQFVQSRRTLPDSVLAAEKVIEVANELRSIGNFNSLVALAAALHGGVLGEVLNMVSPTSRESMRALSELVDQTRNWGTLRTAMQDRQKSIPYIGMFLADMVFIENASTESTDTGFHVRRAIVFQAAAAPLMRAIDSYFPEIESLADPAMVAISDLMSTAFQ